jgi:hypothetical protein
MIKLKDLLVEYGNEPDIKKQWAVVLKGGSIGSGGGWSLDGMSIRYSFDDQDAAKRQAKRSNKRLSPGEKKYYGMRYLVRDIVKLKSRLKKEGLRPASKGAINEGSNVKFEVHSDPDKTERSFVAGFEELAKGHGRIIDYGPRESDIYDWNSRKNYDLAIKEYNTYMTKIAMRLNSTVHDMNQIWKKWDVIRTKYRNKDKD